MTTLSDVAAKAKVGISTVSYVLNKTGLHKVSVETQERILAAAKELHYVPNIAGKALRKGKTYTVATLFPELKGSFAFNILSGLESELDRENYSILFCRYHDCQEFISKCRSLSGRQIDAVIVLGGYPEALGALKELNKCHPVIALACKNPLPGMPSVYVDGVKLSYLAVRHLVELGHKFIGVNPGNDESRICGAKLAVKNTGSKLFFNAEKDQRGNAFLEWGLNLRKGITGFVAFSDTMAIELMGAAIDRGLRIPEDISVVGVDGEDLGSFYRPSLTTMRQPSIAQGASAAQVMLEVINNGYAEDRILMPELLQRSSTGPKK